MRAEPTFADAILDRIMHNAYRLELNGPSMRKIKAAAAEAAGQRDLSDTSGASSASTKPTKGAKR